MNEWKEFWRVWDGEAKPPTNINRILFSDGEALDVTHHQAMRWMSDVDLLKGAINDAAAYTTGQMRRRAECYCKKPETEFVNTDDDGRCYKCKGKGYRWEYKQ